MEFTEFDLNAELQKGISDSGYITCMPVQEQVMKNAFSGSDLYVQSQTGTGKTAAYLIVILQRLLSEPLLGGKKALIMVPTRELAVQVEEEARKLAKHLPFKVGSFYGGVGYAHQQKALRDNVQIMVGTPGRVLDLHSSGQMLFADLAFLVVDEADRMFDMGFYPDLRKLIKVIPPADRRQTMLFSATLNAWVKNLAWEYTINPIEIEIEPEHVTVEEIDQTLYHVTSEDKMKLLLGIFKKESPESAIVFCNTKRYTEIVAKRLRINGIEAEFIIGDLPQSKRLQIIDDVKAGRRNFLVATDVAARGLDIESLSLVVNYDLPNEAENYVHRIGRTARAGKSGKAFSFASEQDVYGLPAIEKYIGNKIPSLIASAEDYAEDKSEGMHIRTDNYGDDRDDRRDSRRSDGRYGERRGSYGDSRGGRSGGGRGERGGYSRGEGSGRGPSSGRSGSGGRPHGAPQKSGESTSSGGAQHRDQRPSKSQRGARDGAPARDNRAQDGRSAAKADLSKVSFEERMAYYRRKYGENFSEPVASGDKAKGGENQRSTEKGGRKGSRPGAQGSGRNRGAKSGEGREIRRDGSGQKGPATGRPAAASAEGSDQQQKKGILGRILGIFGKK